MGSEMCIRDSYKYEATSFLIGTSTIKIVLIARAVRGRFPVNRDLWHRASVDERVELVLSHALSEWSRALRCYKCRGVFRVARIVPFLVNSFFF